MSLLLLASCRSQQELQDDHFAYLNSTWRKGLYYQRFFEDFSPQDSDIRGVSIGVTLFQTSDFDTLPEAQQQLRTFQQYYFAAGLVAAIRDRPWVGAAYVLPAASPAVDYTINANIIEASGNHVVVDFSLVTPDGQVLFTDERKCGLGIEEFHSGKDPLIRLWDQIANRVANHIKGMDEKLVRENLATQRKLEADMHHAPWEYKGHMQEPSMLMTPEESMLLDNLDDEVVRQFTDENPVRDAAVAKAELLRCRLGAYGHSASISGSVPAQFGSSQAPPSVSNDEAVRLVDEVSSIEREKLLAPVTAYVEDSALKSTPAYVQWERQCVRLAAKADAARTRAEEAERAANRKSTAAGIAMAVGGAISVAQASQGSTPDVDSNLEPALSLADEADEYDDQAEAYNEQIDSLLSTISDFDAGFADAIGDLSVQVLDTTYELTGSFDSKSARLRQVVRDRLAQLNAHPSPTGK